jgi:acyl dehydratase
VSESVFSHNNVPICRIVRTSFLRGLGGHGGNKKLQSDTIREGIPPVPHRAPDAVTRVAISEHQAALYRLTGDANPLHIDPAVVKSNVVVAVIVSVFNLL